MSASCMYLRSTHTSAGFKMSFRMRRDIAEGNIPFDKTDIPGKRGQWCKDTACTLFCLLAHVISGRW